MGISFTPRQQEVIDAPIGNLLVSAAAGSGKTAVLVQRILSMITRRENPINIDEILVVTFTNNAAAQMKERIQLAVDAALREDPDNVHLIRQSGRVSMANIMTIDAYCQSIVKRYFHKLDIDPNFRIMDETESKLLWSEAVDAVLEKLLEEGDSLFYQLAECYGGNRGDRMLEKYISQLHKFSDSAPWPEEWLAGATDILKAPMEEMDEQPYMRELLGVAKAELRDALGFAQLAAEATMGEDGAIAYADAINDDIAMIRLAMRCSTYEEFQAFFADVSYTPLSRKKQPDASEEKKQQVKDYREITKKILKTLKDEYFAVEPQQLADQLSLCAPLMDKLVEVTVECVREYHKRQREENAFGFSEIEHMALDILLEHEEQGNAIPSDAAIQCRRQYREILIDEYQDSNLIQDLLLRSVSTEAEGIPNVFMVGDVKQSIYKFRMARPELFLDKYNRYGINPEEGRRIDLQQNFRSHPTILEGINSVFRKIMQAGVGGIDYTDEVALNPPDGKQPVLEELPRNQFLLCVSEEGQSKSEVVISAIVGEIRKMTSAGSGYVTEENGRLRPIGYGDIVILVRSMTGVAYPLIDALQTAGIPAYATSMTGYFESREVQTVLSLLRVLDNPLQDIPFATVLRSPFGGFSERELAELHVLGEALAVEHKIPYQYEVLTYLKQLEPCTQVLRPLKEKAVHFLALYEELYEKKGVLSVPELIEAIYETTGYLAYVTVMPEGHFREKNLRTLHRRAKQFAKGNFAALCDFVAYLEHMMKYEIKVNDDGAGGTENAVRVMTIHASKGLEFPVVILPDTERKFNMQDLKDSLVLHEDLGIGPKTVDLVRRTKSDTLPKKVIAKRRKLDLLGEELRVLYVALTRAKDYLTVVGYVDEPDSLDKKIGLGIGRRVLDYITVSSADSYLSWLLPAIASEAEEPKLIAASARREEECNAFSCGWWRLQVSFYEPTVSTVTEQERREESNTSYVDQVLQEYHSFSYPYATEQVPPVKVSVSELKHAAMEENAVEWNAPCISMSKEEPKEPIPAFAKEAVEEVKGSDRGTLYHRVLELHDYHMELTAEACRKELQQMVARKQLTEKALSVLSVDKLMGYYRSPIGQRMRVAAQKGHLHREQAFVMQIPARYIDVSYGETDTVLVQGIIDAFFEEDGKIVLLDYKTDSTHNVANPEEMLRGRYAEQLRLYADAIERGTGKKVKESLIYSFGLQKELVL